MMRASGPVQTALRLVCCKDQMKAFRTHIIRFVVIIAGLAATVPSHGCPIPVYRYALEFWEADPYIVEVFHRGPLSEGHMLLADKLSAASRGDGVKANLQFRLIDTRNSADEVALGYIKRVSPPEFPWVVVRYPRVSGINEPLWSGPLTAGNVDMLLHSPGRALIGEKLAAGTTSVWVFVESGDRRRDREALSLTRSVLDRLEQTLVLPELELWLDTRSGPVPEDMPQVSFEIVTLSPADHREKYLIDMLMGSEEDLREFEGEPFLFPVYGRGIALWAIVGAGINEWNIREAAEFLTGPCSCQAKLLNPGVDLLMAMDWDASVQKIADISLANPLSGMAGFTGREEEVRRMLEEATLNRLGSTGRANADSGAEPGRVVYLDIFGTYEGVPDPGTRSGDPSEEAGTRASREADHQAGQPSATSPGNEATADTGAGTATRTGTGPDRPPVGDTAREADAGPGRLQQDQSVTGQPRQPQEPGLSAQRSSSQDIADQPAAGQPRQPQEPGLSARRTSSGDHADGTIRESGKRPPHITIIYIFAAVIGLVLVGGVILYWKNIR